MQWIGAFRRNVWEACNGVDDCFSSRTLRISGILTPDEVHASETGPMRMAA